MHVLQSITEIISNVRANSRGNVKVTLADGYKKLPLNSKGNPKFIPQVLGKL